jgi:uncharacterized protein (TIGR02466 family)
MIKSSTFDVYPLYPSVVASVDVTEDLSNFNKIKELEYPITVSNANNKSSRSYTVTLFDDFESEKEILLNYFNQFKNDVLKVNSTEFTISTSWATKTEYGTESQSHRHKNSYYSGVLYLDSDPDAGELILTNHGLATHDFYIWPTEWNIFNYEEFYFKPKKNLLVFFPSYLMHQINTHKSKQPRYSIAFNIVPVGLYGLGDSSIHTKIL